MVALSWEQRLSRLRMPDDQLIDGLARALYMTHCRATAPRWENASEAARDWSRAQAREGLIYLRSLTGRSR